MHALMEMCLWRVVDAGCMGADDPALSDRDVIDRDL